MKHLLIISVFVYNSLSIMAQVGIGTTAPHGELQLSNLENNRKIVLYENMDNSHQFFGFGLNNGVLRYQTDGIGSHHIFHAATSANSSNELMRIQGNGNIGINYSNPGNRLDIVASGTRTGSHPTNLPLYVTGDIGSWNNGIEFRHNNGAEGIGLGYNTIYAAGSNVSQNLGLAAKGTAGNLLFFNNGIERMRISANGNVGINNASPNALLQFDNSLQNRKLVLYDSYNNDHEFFGLGINGAAMRYQVDGLASNHIFFAGASSLGSNELMRIQGNGNIGINNSNPASKLDVATSTRTGSHATNLPLYVTGNIGSWNNGIEFRHNNGAEGIGFGYNTMYAAGSNSSQNLGLAAKGVSGNLLFFNNGIERMRITANGNVGINNASPNALLQFDNSVQNRKLVFYDTYNNDHQYFGLGINDAAMRYQVDGTSSDHVFYAASSPTTSNELMRVKGDGNVDVSGALEIGYGTYSTAPTTLSPLGNGSATCNCPTGSAVIGGGFFVSDYVIVVGSSYPVNNNSWVVWAKNTSAFLTANFTAYAICARLGN